MEYRQFGRTGLSVSEVGFGAWAIGGRAYGAVDRKQALDALARAEELGCNFVDTAPVYGDSESILGEFLCGRRDRWIVATKYSDKSVGMTQTLERQLGRLRTETIDFYQIHWAPGRDGHALYDEIDSLKRSGKVRFVGVSLYSTRDIDYVIDHTHLDGIQVAFSLLDPQPFLARVDRLRASGLGVIVRSSLKEGFLTGKFTQATEFRDGHDQRRSWDRRRIERTLEQVERFRFLGAEAGSLTRAAVGYPLSFPEVSTVILGTKDMAQASENFGAVPGVRLDARQLGQVRSLQKQLGLGQSGFLRRLARRVLRSGLLPQ